MKQIKALGLGIIMIVLLTPAALASSTHSTSYKITQLTETSYQENKPIIYRDFVVYAAFATSVDIYGYDIKTNTEVTLVDRPGEQWPAALNNKYLLYTEYTTTDLDDVRLLNLKTGEDLLLFGGASNQTAHDMENQLVAYTEGSGCGDLYIFHLGNQNQDMIATNAYGAKISGRTVVWYECSGGGYYNVRGYDLKSREQIDISDESVGYQEMPDIYRTDVVWSDRTPGQNRIMLNDIKRGEESVIYESDTEILTYPVISQKYVAWVTDKGTGAHDIAVYNRKSGEILDICDNGPQIISPTIPDIYRDQVVWMSWHSGNGDIYLAKMVYPSR